MTAQLTAIKQPASQTGSAKRKDGPGQTTAQLNTAGRRFLFTGDKLGKLNPGVILHRLYKPLGFAAASFADIPDKLEINRLSLWGSGERKKGC